MFYLIHLLIELVLLKFSWIWTLWNLWDLPCMAFLRFIFQVTSSAQRWPLAFIIASDICHSSRCRCASLCRCEIWSSAIPCHMRRYIRGVPIPSALVSTWFMILSLVNLLLFLSFLVRLLQIHLWLEWTSVSHYFLLNPEWLRRYHVQFKASRQRLCQFCLLLHIELLSQSFRPLSARFVLSICRCLLLKGSYLQMSIVMIFLLIVFIARSHIFILIWHRSTFFAKCRLRDYALFPELLFQMFSNINAKLAG